MIRKSLMMLTFFLGTCLISFTRCFSQIQGGVYGPKEQVIANALIKASNEDGKLIDSVRSDKRGFYMFKGLIPGKYIIEANAPGFHPAIYKNVAANQEDTEAPSRRNDISSATRLEILLKPTGPK